MCVNLWGLSQNYTLISLFEIVWFILVGANVEVVSVSEFKKFTAIVSLQIVWLFCPCLFSLLPLRLLIVRRIMWVLSDGIDWFEEVCVIPFFIWQENQFDSSILIFIFHLMFHIINTYRMILLSDAQFYKKFCFIFQFHIQIRMFSNPIKMENFVFFQFIF